MGRGHGFRERTAESTFSSSIHTALLQRSAPQRGQIKKRNTNYNFVLGDFRALAHYTTIRWGCQGRCSSIAPTPTAPCSASVCLDSDWAGKLSHLSKMKWFWIPLCIDLSCFRLDIRKSERVTWGHIAATQAWARCTVPLQKALEGPFS